MLGCALDPMPEPELEFDPTTETFAPDLITSGADWELPIKSLGPVYAFASGKAKKSKKKSKTVLNE